MSSPCPAEEQLVAFAEGALASSALAALHQHLDGCATCRALVADLAAAEPAASAPVGAPIELDEYQLLRPLGHGAMGTVYLAHDTVLDREVAIKWIAMIEPSASARSRFLLEARAIARLQHPNVASVYRVGQIDGRPYLVCEYVRGESLDRLAKPVPRDRLLPLALGLARGLAAAHRQGVLHRDLKPANAILAADGEVKLLDFGLAKLLPRPPGALQMSLSPSSSGPGAPSADSPLPDSAIGDSGAVGTPLYMAPEVWRGEAATPQADIYSLGALLYELATGQPPVVGAHLQQLRDAVLHSEVAPVAARAPSLDPPLAALIDRCLHGAPTQRFASAEQLAQELALLPLAAPMLLPGGNPYRGLAAFDAEHRALFYGRATEIRAVLELLRSEPLVIISGDSGVGKSSLCRAGVLPLCEEGALLGGRVYTTVTLVPGQHPLAGLGAALAAALSTTSEDIKARFAAPGELAAALTAQLGGRAGLVLFIDQMEELVSTSDPDEAATFTQTLRALAEQARGVRVLGALRADFLARVAALPGLGELVRGLYLLRPLGAAGLREVIVNPARVRGVGFESEALVTELVHETLHAEGGLPLLSFALAELWEGRSLGRRTIPATALHTIGGVAGALARHADQLLGRLSPPEKAAARRLLGKLVSAEGLRVRRGEADLCPPEVPAARGALESLLRGRLLVARVVDGASVYEIAHEALVSGWATLRTWLAESREARTLHQRLDQAVSDWERLGHSPDALWGERRLAEARPLLSALPLSQREQEFLAASRRQLRVRVWASRGLVLLPLLFVLLYAGEAYRAYRAEIVRVNQQLGQARELLLRARAERTAADALQQRALRAFEQKDQEEGEQLWAQVLAARATAEATYGAASQTLEAALLSDPQQLPVRTLLSTVLAERALLAERRGQAAHRDELIRRLRLYDPAGEAYRHLSGPVALHLGSSPPGAQVRIGRYIADDQGRRRESDERDLGPTPLTDQAIEAGSYVLTLRAPGRVPVRYPFVAGRGEPVRLHVELPRAGTVPEGMVYVPAGRFLFGGATDEAGRPGRAAPLHAQSTAAYLIAAHETTLADWIAYLRALPASERSRRLPRVASAPLLSEAAGSGYELTLPTPAQTYHARSGEPLRYPGRARPPAQDWLRLPVTSISREDAEAYLKWLDESRRLPGARLCSEREWERAARGADDRPYPHGDALRPADANYAETYGPDPRAQGPDEVGAHPGSASPFLVFDLVGNVSEWVASAGRRGSTRGCAYAAGAGACVLSEAGDLDPAGRSPTVGLRVCAPAPY